MFLNCLAVVVKFKGSQMLIIRAAQNLIKEYLTEILFHSVKLKA